MPSGTKMEVKPGKSKKTAGFLKREGRREKRGMGK
jgi:hypothetical protein